MNKQDIARLIIDVYNAGKEDGHNQGYQLGYDNGYEKGFDRGFTAGQEDGMAQVAGIDEGEDEGEEEKDDLYYQGWQDAFNSRVDIEDPIMRKAEYRRGMVDGFNARGAAMT